MGAADANGAMEALPPNAIGEKSTEDAQTSGRELADKKKRKEPEQIEDGQIPEGLEGLRKAARVSSASNGADTTEKKVPTKETGEESVPAVSSGQGVGAGSEERSMLDLNAPFSGDHGRDGDSGKHVQQASVISSMVQPTLYMQQLVRCQELEVALRESQERAEREATARRELEIKGEEWASKLEEHAWLVRAHAQLQHAASKHVEERGALEKRVGALQEVITQLQGGSNSSAEITKAMQHVSSSAEEMAASRALCDAQGQRLTALMAELERLAAAKTELEQRLSNSKAMLEQRDEAIRCLNLTYRAAVAAKEAAEQKTAGLEEQAASHQRTVATLSSEVAECRETERLALAALGCEAGSEAATQAMDLLRARLHQVLARRQMTLGPEKVAGAVKASPASLELAASPTNLRSATTPAAGPRPSSSDHEARPTISVPGAPPYDSPRPCQSLLNSIPPAPPMRLEAQAGLLSLWGGGAAAAEARDGAEVQKWPPWRPGAAEVAAKWEGQTDGDELGLRLGGSTLRPSLPSLPTLDWLRGGLPVSSSHDDSAGRGSPANGGGPKLAPLAFHGLGQPGGPPAEVRHMLGPGGLSTGLSLSSAAAQVAPAPTWALPIQPPATALSLQAVLAVQPPPAGPAPPTAHPKVAVRPAQQQGGEGEGKRSNARGKRKCPHCSTMIAAAAADCSHCGHMFRPSKWNRRNLPASSPSGGGVAGGERDKGRPSVGGLQAGLEGEQRWKQGHLTGGPAGGGMEALAGVPFKRCPGCNSMLAVGALDCSCGFSFRRQAAGTPPPGSSPSGSREATLAKGAGQGGPLGNPHHLVAKAAAQLVGSAPFGGVTVVEAQEGDPALPQAEALTPVAQVASLVAQPGTWSAQQHQVQVIRPTAEALRDHSGHQWNMSRPRSSEKLQGKDGEALSLSMKVGS